MFAKEAKKQKDIKFLAQGIIYPDILESKGVKAHHNVGGLPKSMVYRQPFPGPGLGVNRVLLDFSNKPVATIEWE